MLPERCSMRILAIWAALSTCLFIPVDVVQISAALIVFTFFPGWALLHLLSPEEKNVLVYILYGGAFMTLLVYYCGWIVYWHIPLILSLGCVLYLEKKKAPLPPINTSTLFLCGCMLFMITYLYPWEHYIAFFPPGDEMKLHLLYTTSLLETHTLPGTYAPLYPEISHLGQPLGFHGITGMVADSANASPIVAGTLVGLFTGSLGCISVYLLGRTLFNESTGLAAAFSFAFLSFLSHQLGASGSYVVLAGITFQVAAVAALIQVNQKKGRSHFVLAGLLCAACFSTDMIAFIPLALFIVFYMLCNRFLYPVLASIILFSIPQLARFSVSTPLPLEVRFLEEWFRENLITGGNQLQTILFSMGPLLLLFALLQIASQIHISTILGGRKPTQQENEIIPSWSERIRRLSTRSGTVLGIYWFSFLIPLIFGHLFPFWYMINPSLIFRMSVIPLAILSGMFLVRIHSHSKYRGLFLGLIVLCIIIHHTDPFLTLPHSPPTVTEDSLSAYRWIEENTSETSYICNFLSHGDSSTWIPVTAHRPVFLPFHLYYHGDNAMSSLQLPQRFVDTAILTRIPHTEFAYDIAKTHGFTHLYIDEKSPIEESLLIDSPLYSPEFQKGNIHIFSITDNAQSCNPIQYQPGKLVWCGNKSYFHFSHVTKGTVLIIYYKDEGMGNVDVEINGTYVGTIFRFNSGNHFSAVFTLHSLPDAAVSILPYETCFEIEYLVVYDCSSREQERKSG
jgi:hypothetical protein